MCADDGEPGPFKPGSGRASGPPEARRLFRCRAAFSINGLGDSGYPGGHPRPGAAYGLKLLSREIRKPKAAAEKWLGQDGKIIALTCLHLANSSPFALEHRLISLKNVPEAAEVEFSEEPPGSWLLGHVAWSEAENRITAISADRAIAKLLHLDVGTACLNLERRTWRGAARITQVRQLFPGHLFELVARFNPGVPTRGPDAELRRENREISAVSRQFVDNNAILEFRQQQR